MQAGQGEQITIDAVPRESNAEPMSPVEALQQRGEDELARRLDKVEKRSAFEQADREAAPGKAAAEAQKEGELDAMAEQARYERELPPLQQMAARIRNKTADLAGERARLLREREEAQADDKAKAEQPTTEGIEVSEAFGAPANSAMADALRQAGVTSEAPKAEPEQPKVKLADAAAQARDKIPDLAGERARLERERQEAEPFPDEIRPTSGKPYKSQASAENIIKIRKLKGYEPVEADGGWVLRKVADVDKTVAPAGSAPGNETATQGVDREGAGPAPGQGGAAGQADPGSGGQITTGPGAATSTLHPYEDELAWAVRTWSKRHDDAYKARPSYADEAAAFRKGFEDRAAGRDSAAADLKDLAQRDYELGYSMGKYGAAHYEDWVTGKDKRQGPITTGPSRSGIGGTTGTIEPTRRGCLALRQGSERVG